MDAGWLAQATAESGSALPAWWPIAALVVPLVFAVVVAIIQMSAAIRAARITADARTPAIPTDAIAEEVAKVLGQELDRRLGSATMADAQAAFEQGRREAEVAAQAALDAHRQAIQELQAKLAARDAEPDGTKPEALAAAMLYNAGFDAQQAGILGEAIGLYSAAIRLDPTYAKAFYNRANAKFALGDFRAAIEDYDEAIRLDPTDARALYNCGNSKAEIGDHAGAIQDYSESIRIDPNYPHAYYNRANSKVALGDSSGGVEDYDRALTIDPDYAAAYYNKACEASKSGDGPQAIEHLRKAIAIDLRWKGQASHDPDFDPIAASDEFKNLIA